jgi:hypothetical protein
MAFATECIATTTVVDPGQGQKGSKVSPSVSIAGHRIGTAEVENTLTGHPACSEAAVIGYTLTPMQGLCSLHKEVQCLESSRRFALAAARTALNQQHCHACRIDHEVKGQAIYAFVTLSDEAGKAGDREGIKTALVGHIRSQIGEACWTRHAGGIRVAVVSACKTQLKLMPYLHLRSCRRLCCARGHPLGARYVTHHASSPVCGDACLATITLSQLTAAA